jgi:hypothetical protein
VSGPTLTNFPLDPLLDLPNGMGQRSSTFRFDLINGVTGEILGQVHPIRAASLTHDTTRTIKRQLSFPAGVEATADINTRTDRVLVTMVLSNGDEWPLGRYMFTDASRVFYTSGKLGAFALNDEMFLVDQEIEAGINGFGKPTSSVVQEVLTGLPVTLEMEASPFLSAEAWGAGTQRGQILEALSMTGDWFSPWFGNDASMHLIRTFDPSTQVADFDFDEGNKVLREPIVETDDLLTAPNRFVVLSNAPVDTATPVVAAADVPPNAPHSRQNRGFAIVQTVTLQLSSQAQAAAAVQGIANRQTIFERVSLATAPDPRHDSYNVIKWQGELWLELAWSMILIEGGAMNHLLRKSYT